MLQISSSVVVDVAGMPSAVQNNEMAEHSKRLARVLNLSLKYNQEKTFTLFGTAASHISLSHTFACVEGGDSTA